MRVVTTMRNRRSSSLLIASVLVQVKGLIAFPSASISRTWHGGSTLSASLQTSTSPTRPLRRARQCEGCQPQRQVAFHASSRSTRWCRRRRDCDSSCMRRRPGARWTSVSLRNMSLSQAHDREPGSDGETRVDFLRALCWTALGLASAASVLGLRREPARAIDLGGVEFGFQEQNKFDIPAEDNPNGLKSPRPLAYRVDYTDPPTTVPFPRTQEDDLVAEMARQRLVFFGTHDDSGPDHQTAANLMRRIAERRKGRAGIGLEQVERQFQPALEAYIDGGREAGASESGDVLDAADAQLAKDTQWEERSAFPFEALLPVLHLARRRGLPLVALGMDSERMFEVMRSGMDALREDDRNAYVSDFKGFVTYVRDKGFQTYAEKLIFSSYERLNERGLLGDKPPTKPNFFSARILADEALASKAVEWATANSDKVLLVLQREDRVKFGFGASGRASRIAKSFGDELPTKTALINPTAQDTFSQTRALRLALAYADDLYDGKPVADYLWFSKSPMVNLIPRMINAEKKGWLENINLYELRDSART